MELVTVIFDIDLKFPENKRQEIGRELKANICDQLDALSEQGKLTEAQTAEVLKTMGHPRKVAQQFSPSAPIVAVEDIPLLTHTLFMVLGVLFVLQVVGGTTQWLGTAESSLVGFLYYIAAGFIEDASFAFTAIVLSFWLVSMQGKIVSGHHFQKWQPQNLPKVGPAWEHISLSDVFTDLATYLFLLLVIWSSVWMSNEQLSTPAVMFSANAQQLLQWFTPIIVLSVFNSLWQLRRRVWAVELLVVLAFSSPILQSTNEGVHVVVK